MIRAIIIDDEELAISNLQMTIEEYCTEIEVVGTATSLIEGAKLWKVKSPALVFLDVEMREGTGFDLLELFPDSNCLVVMVTAHENYTITALRNRVFDYLLKPIDLEDLHLLEKRLLTALETDLPSEKIKIPMRDGFHLVERKNIIALKAEQSYTTFYFVNRTKEMVSGNLGFFEKQFIGTEIVRCHKSYCVNLNHVIGFSSRNGGVLKVINELEFPISNSRKNEVIEKLNR